MGGAIQKGTITGAWYEPRRHLLAMQGLNRECWSLRTTLVCPAYHQTASRSQASLTSLQRAIDAGRLTSWRFLTWRVKTSGRLFPNGDVVYNQSHAWGLPCNVLGRPPHKAI